MLLSRTLLACCLFSAVAAPAGDLPLLPASGVSNNPAIQVPIAQAVDPLPQPDNDESYYLQVSSNGVLLKANTRFGAMRGIRNAAAAD